MNESKNLLIVLGEWWEQRRAASPEDARPRQPSRVRRILRWFAPNGGTLLLVAVLILTQQVWARPLASPAAPGPSANTVNYQGKLANPDGTPVADNTYAMSFSLWDASTGGSAVWGPEDHAVPVSDGLFSVGLGSKNLIPTSVWNGDRYLEITVGGETLSPRELIRSVPIAGMALTVPDGAITSDKLSRQMIRVVATSDVPMPIANTTYDILATTITLDRETLVTIHASIAPYNNSADAFFLAYVAVDGSWVTRSDTWNKAGIGEQSMMSTALLLGPGQHQVKLRAFSWSSNSFVAGDQRTQLVVVEG